MESEVIYRANFDYEIELFSLNKDETIRKEFEYLFFWVENSKSSLMTDLNYDESYLKDVFSKTKNKILLTRKLYNKNWWGELKDIELEKKLNSKITSYDFAIKNSYCHPLTKIIKTSDDILLQDQRNYVLKSPFLMAGNGFFLFNHSTISKAKDWANKNLKQGPLILEPWLTKIIDIGTYIVEREEVVHYLNFSNERGNYKGTRVYKEQSNCFNYLSFLGADIDQFIFETGQIIEYYFQLGAKCNFSIDSFLYKHESQIKLYSLSEINYRKTMGYVALALMKNNRHQVGELFFLPKTNKKHDHKVLSELNITLLSPVHTRFNIFWIEANTDDEIEEREVFIKKE